MFEGREVRSCCWARAPSLRPAGGCAPQLADVQEMMFDWRGSLAVTLNAGWDAEQTEGDLSAFLRAFETIYCFQPLAIQVSPGCPPKSARNTNGAGFSGLRAVSCTYLCSC